MKIITIVQARMSSTRLPGKVSMDILGKTLLERQLERMSQAKLLGDIVVAISDNPKDDILEELCIKNGYLIFRGSENDLLDRHYHCALHYKADIVSKIPSDCPLIDSRVIDRVFKYFLENSFDFVSNLHPASYPDGNDVEIFTFSALEKAFKEAKRPLEREHTTPYFWENPHIFSIGNVLWEAHLDFSMSHRFTIDYPEDFDFIHKIYSSLYPINSNFSLEMILDLLEKNSSIYAINSTYAGVNWYRNHIEELKTIDASKTKKNT